VSRALRAPLDCFGEVMSEGLRLPIVVVWDLRSPVGSGVASRLPVSIGRGGGEPGSHAGVTLRPLQVERDLAVLHAIFGDAEQMKYMLEAPMASEEETRAKIAACSEHPDSPRWAIAGDDGETRGRSTLIAKREGGWRWARRSPRTLRGRASPAGRSSR